MSAFKFSTRTLDILKNFSSINPSMVFRPGQQISTLSNGRKILARAHIEEHIENVFAIYELNRFFGAISLFKEPNLEVKKEFVVIGDEQRSLRYITAEIDNIVSPSESAMTELPSVDVSFSIDEKMIKDATKAAAVLGQPDLVFKGDGDRVLICTQNIAKPTNEIYSQDVGKFEGGQEPFTIILKVENIKLYPGDYKINICFKKIVQFIGNDVTYIVAAEANSTVPKTK